MRREVVDSRAAAASIHVRTSGRRHKRVMATIPALRGARATRAGRSHRANPALQYDALPFPRHAPSSARVAPRTAFPPIAMPIARASRAGSTARTVVLVLGALALVLFGLWRFLATSGGAERTSSATSAANAPVEAAHAELSGSDEGASSLVGASEGGVRAGAIPVGVRLTGEGRLSGHVLDRTSGFGVGGVRVDLLPVPPVGAGFLGRMLRVAGMGDEMATRTKPIAVAQTAADGSFRFENVRTGTWYVDVRGPYHARESVVRARVVASGSGGPLDLWVRPGGRVLGTVIRPDGRPSANTTVELVPGPGMFLESMRKGELEMCEARTDSEGRFVFEGVPPGEGYEVTAAPSGFALTHTIGVTVRALADTQVDVRLRVGGTVRGRIVSAPEHDLEHATPLANAQLGAVPRGLRDLRCAEELLQTTHCTSGADGTFTMPNVPPGEVDLVAIAPGHLPALGAHVSISDATVATCEDIALVPGPMVRGRVVDSSGNPVPSARIRWNMVDWQSFQFDFSLAPMMAQAVKGWEYPTSDAEGNFQAGPFAGKAPYRIDVSKLGFDDGHVDWKPSSENASGDVVEVVLRRGGSIEGIVMDEARAEPVKLFTITTNDKIDVEEGVPGGRNPFTGGTTIEDERGRFVLESLSPGKVDLVVSAPGYLDARVDDVQVAEGKPTKGIIVKLQPGGTVRGIVVDDRDQPVVAASVAAVKSGGGAFANTPAERLSQERRDRRARPRMPMERMFGDIPQGAMNLVASLGLLGDKAALTNSKGEFELRGVPLEAVRVLAFHRDFASGSSDVLALTAETPLEGLRIVMNRGGGIEGRVVDRFGRPVPNSIVVAVAPNALGGGGDPSAGAIFQGQSNEAGQYSIRHVSAGAYFLVATRGDEALQPASFFGNMNFDLVTVPPGQTVTYDVLDSSAGGCRVRGTVSCGGRPLDHGTLSAISFESESMLGVDFKATRVKDGGTFEFPGLAPGDYQLNLDGNGAQIRLTLEVPDEPELFVELHCPEGAVEGTVVDAATNQPVSGIDLVLRPLDRGERPTGLLGQMIAREGSARRGVNTDDGSFAIRGLTEGDYELVARPRGEKSKSYGPSEAQRVHVDADRTTRDVLVKMPAALSIRGIVRDEQGAPVAGAAVVGVSQSDDLSSNGRATSDDQGAFELRGLAAGKFDVSASKDGFASSRTRSVELVRGTSAPEVEIELTKGVEVVVRVFGSDGRPVSGARAELVGKGERVAQRAANADRFFRTLFDGSGTTDAEGRVHLGRHNPGEYRLEAQRGVTRAARDSVTVPAGQDEVELRIDL